MSAKRKRINNKPPSQPLVRIDENGKVWALPVNWNKELPREQDTSEKGGVSGTKQDVKRRKFIPIGKLNPTPYIYEDSPFSAPKKSQGIDNKCIRKELFKIPADNRKTLMKRPDATGAVKSTILKKLNPTNDIPPGTPLMELEQAEKLIEDKPQRQTIPFPFKPIPKPVMEFGIRNMVTPSRTHEPTLETVTEVETPGSKDSNISNTEFLALEEQCCSSAETKSPLTNVCNLLQNTRLNRNTPEGSPKTINPSTVAAKVEKMFEKWNERFDVVKKQHEEDIKKIAELHSERLAELQKQQAQDMTVIMKLLQTTSSNASKSSSKNKENRRSTRIAEQQAVSPVISKSADLRKSTLKKNLSKNIEIERSPRLRKAVDLYNDIRGNYSILCTPRMSRNEMVSPGGSMVKKTLSRRIQEQCLLLQETPR